MTNGEITNIYDLSPKSGSTKSLVILLHGLGSNGRDLISLAPLWANDMQDTAFVSPDAPFACDMVPPGYPDSFQWFSLQTREPQAILEGIERAFPILKDFILQQAEHYDVPLSKVALVGFSQGTMMSLYTAPRIKGLAGVLGYSGALHGTLGEHKLPIHLIHGEADDVVPVKAYTHAKSELEQAGFEVSGHTSAGLTHSIDEKGIQSGGAFLQDALSS